MFKFNSFKKHYEGYEDYFDNVNLDNNTNIFRYMDLWKFISLIENKQLCFTKQSKFTDIHEGALNEELNTALIKLPKPFTEFLAKSLKNMKETNRISC